MVRTSHGEDANLTITLDSTQTKNERKVVRELGVSLTETRARYPGTDLILEYAIKGRP